MPFTTVIGSIVGTGTSIIPAGAKRFTILTTAGTSYINGVAIVAGVTPIEGGGHDSKLLLKTAITMGTTGVGNNITYFYDV